MGAFPRLGYVILVVGDVERTMQFYERAFGLARDHVDADGSYGEMLAGSETRLGFASREHASAQLPQSDFGATDAIALHLLTSDVDDTYNRALSAHATPLSPPRDFPWGRMGRVRDLNGFIVELSAERM